MQDTDKQDFWGHLDILRAILVRIFSVIVVFGIVAFIFKEELFAIVLAPKEENFITYRVLFRIAEHLHVGGFESFSVQLINTALSEQFTIHLKMAMCAGVLCASPYILYQLFRFVSPALYANERRFAIPIVGGGYLMFMLGVLVNYFLIFPLTFRFLGTYQVSGEVTNMISLQSYVSTLIMMSIALGVVFEMPVLAWLFAKMGFISSEFMRHYRRHAIVIILVAAAIITPTSDVFTLMLVALPMYLLYEVSILLVRHVKKDFYNTPVFSDKCIS